MSTDPRQAALHHFQQGNACFTRRELDQAQRHWEAALRLVPDAWPVHVNLGLLRRARGEFDRARGHFTQALTLRPGAPQTFGYLLDMLLSLGDFDAVAELDPLWPAVIERAAEVTAAAEIGPLLFLAPYIGLDPDRLAALQTHLERLLVKPGVALAPRGAGDGAPIRIGYLSPDFGDHAVSHVLRGVFDHHDRARFTIVAYSIQQRTGPQDHPWREGIRAQCEAFVDLTPFTPHQAAERIAADRIDILVNLAGYTSVASLEVCAFRPAPIQVFWLGHAGGLGLSCFDYLIADRIVVPEGEASRYREQVVRLPDCYHCADTPAVPEPSCGRVEQGLDPGAFVYCAFNNPIKIDRAVFDVWMEILRRVPGSQLWLSNPGGEPVLENNLRAQAGAAGVDPARLVFAGRVPDKSSHLARHRLADLFLDTFNYTASTTAIDALWAGLPVLTRSGGEFASRIATTLVTHAGLPEMVCATPEDFVARAVALARDRATLMALRARLDTLRAGAPLFDVPRFARHLEAAYAGMWRRRVAGGPPSGFDVPSSG